MLFRLDGLSAPFPVFVPFVVVAAFRVMRVAAIDIFRCLTMAVMIFVNGLLNIVKVSTQVTSNCWFRNEHGPVSTFWISL